MTDAAGMILAAGAPGMTDAAGMILAASMTTAALA